MHFGWADFQDLGLGGQISCQLGYVEAEDAVIGRSIEASDARAQERSAGREAEMVQNGHTVIWCDPDQVDRVAVPDRIEVAVAAKGRRRVYGLEIRRQHLDFAGHRRAKN